MATISSLGAGSGLDLEGLVTKLMAVEQQPITVLNTKIASYNTKLSALGSLKSVISSLQTAAKALTPSIGQTAQANLAAYSATLGDTAVGTATADSTAASSTGDYSMTVVQAARSDRLTFAANPTLTAGTSLSIAVGSGSSVSVSITAGMTISGLRDAINSAGAGVSATLIGGSQLVLTSSTSGANGRITLSGDAGFSWNPGTNTGTNITQATDARGQDAQITLNGVTLTSASNTFADAVDGVDITLKAGVAANTTTTLTVAADTSTKSTKAVNDFVSAYNSFISTIKQYGYYNATTKTAGTLQGDYTLRSAQTQLYNTVTSAVSGVTGSITRLSQLGVGIQKDGTLSVDSTKLSNAISSNFTDVSNFLSALGTAVDESAKLFTKTGGLIANATDTLNSKVSDAQDRQARLETRLTQIEARYRAQFSALDTMIAGMNSTSTYLTQQLSALASMTKSK